MDKFKVGDIVFCEFKYLYNEIKGKRFKIVEVINREGDKHYHHTTYIIIDINNPKFITSMLERDLILDTQSNRDLKLKKLLNKN